MRNSKAYIAVCSLDQYTANRIAAPTKTARKKPTSVRNRPERIRLWEKNFSPERSEIFASGVRILSLDRNTRMQLQPPLRLCRRGRLQLQPYLPGLKRELPRDLMLLAGGPDAFPRSVFFRVD